MTIIIETERTALRSFTMADVADLAPIFADPGVMRFSVNGPMDIKATEKAIAKYINSYQENHFGLWAAIHKDDAILMGYCGLIKQEIEGEKFIELGYRLARSSWGRGLATEMAKAVCEYAFKSLSLSEVIAIIEADNLLSIRVAEKVGMQFAHESVFHRIPVHIYKLSKQC